MQREGDFAGHVVIAGARPPQVDGCVRNNGLGPPAGEHHERLQRCRNPLIVKTVVAMLALRHHFDEIQLFEPCQMHAGAVDGLTSAITASSVLGRARPYIRLHKIRAERAPRLRAIAPSASSTLIV